MRYWKALIALAGLVVLAVVWPFWVGIIVGGLVGLFILLSLLYFWMDVKRFRRAPETQWRDRVMSSLAAAQRRIHQEEEEIKQVAVEDQAQERALYQEAFQRTLKSVSVDKLDAYPGIGPATIARLREAGCHDLASLNGRVLEIPSLGERRTQEVRAAVEDLVKQTHSRFAAGGCREAVELRAKIQVVRTSATEQGYRARARMQAAQAFIKEMEPTRRLAELVTYHPFVQPTEEMAVVSLACGRPWPDLDKLIRKADEKARVEYAAAQSRPPVALVAEPAKQDIVVAAAAPALAAAPLAAQRVGRSDSAAQPAARPSSTEDLFRDALQKTPAAAPARSRKPVPAERKVVSPPTAPVATPVAIAQPAPCAPAPPAPSPRPAPPDHWAALEIDHALPLSTDLIRRQYHLLSDRYAPDKFQNVGPEFVAMAKNKRDAVEQAAHALLETLGEKLVLAPTVAEPVPLRSNPDLDAVFGV